MNIPNEILGKWEALKSQGDIKEIAEKNKVSTVTIINAIKYGVCTMNVFRAIADFYEAKEAEINSYMPK